MPRSRAHTPTPNPPPPPSSITAAEIDRLVERKIQNFLVPFVDDVHRCESCSQFTDSPHEVCRGCQASFAYPNPDRFISSFCGWPAGNYPADLTERIKEQTGVSFEDLQDVINKADAAGTPDEAIEYILFIYDLAYREPCNPISPYYPKVFTGENRRVVNEDHSLSYVDVYTQGAVVFQNTPIEEIIWSKPPRPRSPSEIRAAKEENERRLSEARKETQMRHLEQKQTELEKVLQEVESAKQDLSENA